MPEPTAPKMKGMSIREIRENAVEIGKANDPSVPSDVQNEARTRALATLIDHLCLRVTDLTLASGAKFQALERQDGDLLKMVHDIGGGPPGEQPPEQAVEGESPPEQTPEQVAAAEIAALPPEVRTPPKKANPAAPGAAPTAPPPPNPNDPAAVAASINGAKDVPPAAIVKTG